MVIRSARAIGLELSCPADARNTSRTLRHAGGQDKQSRKPSPPVSFSELLGGFMSREGVT